MPPKKKVASKPVATSNSKKTVTPAFREHNAELDILLANYDAQVKARLENMKMEHKFQEQILLGTKQSVLASIPLELRNIRLGDFVEVYNGNIADVLRLESFERQHALDDYVLQIGTKTNSIKPATISSMSQSTKSNLKRTRIGIQINNPTIITADKENDADTSRVVAVKHSNTVEEKKIQTKRRDFNAKFLAAMA